MESIFVVFLDGSKERVAFPVAFSASTRWPRCWYSIIEIDSGSFERPIEWKWLLRRAPPQLSPLRASKSSDSVVLQSRTQGGGSSAFETRCFCHSTSLLKRSMNMFCEKKQCRHLQKLKNSIDRQMPGSQSGVTILSTFDGLDRSGCTSMEHREVGQ